MKSNFIARAFLVCLVLLVPAFSLANENSQEATMQAVELPEGVAELNFKGGILRVKAVDADVKTLLGAVSKASGIELELPPEELGKVTIEIEGSIFEDALRKILNTGTGQSYALDFSNKNVSKITILKQDKTKYPNFPEPGLKRAWTQREARAYFKGKYGEDFYVNVKDSKNNRFSYLEYKIPKYLKIDDLNSLYDYVERFIQDNNDAFPVGLDKLAIDKNAEYDGKKGNRTIMVGYDQYYNGFKIGGIGFIFHEADQRIVVTNYVIPDISVDVVPKITAEQAKEIAKKKLDELAEKDDKIKGGLALIAHLRSRNGMPKDEEPVLSIRGTGYPAPYNYILVWEVHLSPCSFEIDAKSGDVIRSSTGIVESSSTRNPPVK